jgi:hypothetical protein
MNAFLYSLGGIMYYSAHQNQIKRTFAGFIVPFIAVLLALAFSGCNETEIYVPSATSPTDLDPDQEFYTFELYQNYPNPFNPSTTIRFSIGEPSPAVLTIYNESGEVVWRIDLGENEPDGMLEPDDYQIHWTGEDSNKNGVASGVYIYELVAGDFRDSKKMMLLK